MTSTRDRLLIVSNRLPITARQTSGKLVLTPASGGLATGMRPFHESSNGLWIGWPGDVSRFSAADRKALDTALDARGIVPVHLSSEQIDRYYHGFSNRVLWPLFHYLIDRMPVDASGWDAYKEVNAAFADAVARVHKAGDLIWVHDYQLMLLPALLRERLPNARIGFFLHIPFPSADVFRVLPWRREVLDGLLGADLVGFHVSAYMRHFVEALQQVVGIGQGVDHVRVGKREVGVGAFPMGVDAESFAALASDPDVQARTAAIRTDAGGRQIVLGVDRLDYTKGIPRRLAAIERLLNRRPELRDEMRYVQVAVPSRGEVDSYQRFKRLVEESIGRINGACSTLRSTPIHYIHQSVSMRELVALYAAADVMLVTPLRDGMNLVAKEYVASRVNDDGVLVLSEFAGAAAELAGAVVVNPYDVDAVSESIHRALSMESAERETRMRAMRERVSDYTVHRWAAEFLERLEQQSRPRLGAAETRHASWRKASHPLRLVPRACIEQARTMTDRVDIVSYDPDWPRRFDEERRILAGVFAGSHAVIEHVGSTAVPGLGAKPIIDILIGVPILIDVERRIPALETAGYEYVHEDEQPFADRRYFRKPSTKPRRFHVHCVLIGGDFWLRQLAFRDYLRAHPEAAAAYYDLKRDLAMRVSMKEYPGAKSAFIDAIVAAALRDRED
jgi:trehalose 6-phosphate synthase/phosphatase